MSQQETPTYKTLQLKTGEEVKLDPQDHEWAVNHNWCRLQGGRKKYPYAVTSIKDRTTYMHREILVRAGLLDPRDRRMVVDHINHDGLDNRRENLRVVSRSQNNGNARRRTHFKGRAVASSFRGVTYRADRGTKKWLAMVTFQNTDYRLGAFTTEEEAARAYDAKARELDPHFQLNFPDQEEKFSVLESN